MAYIWARVTYRSNRSFSYYDGIERKKLNFERRDSKFTGNKFVIKSFARAGQRAPRGTDGVFLEFDEESMAQIIDAYNKLFP